MSSNGSERIAAVLARRLPALSATERDRLAGAYIVGVQTHGVERTTGTGSVPTNLSTERAELVAFVCRALERLLSEDEIGALLRITATAAKAVQKTMLAVFDDLPLLVFKAAFGGAKRDGRGTQGDIKDGFRVKFSKAEKMEMAQKELERRGLLCEVMEASSSRHVLLVDPLFDIDTVLPE